MIADPQVMVIHAGTVWQDGKEATTLMREAVRATYGPEVLSFVGAFGGLYAAGMLLVLTRQDVDEELRLVHEAILVGEVRDGSENVLFRHRGE